MPMECYNGRVTLSPGTDTLQLPASLLPESRCQSQTGLCFSSLTRVQGVTVLSLGCWPSQHHLQLAWYGVPECKNEVNRLLCLCPGSLCNIDLPQFRAATPEGDLVQGLTAISLVLLLLLSLLLITGCVLVRFSRRRQLSKDSQMKVEAALPPLPPPSTYTRMCSAPAALSCELTRQLQPRNKLRGSLETLLKPFLKSSFSCEKSASRYNKRLETEV